MGLLVAVTMLSTASCAPREGRSADEPRASATNEKQEVIVQRMPDGSIRKTTITRKTVPAPAPPARAADAYPGDPLVRYNVDQINKYRARGGLGPVLYDARLSAFAIRGSRRLASDHVPHANFAEHAESQKFGSRSAENQGDPRGVPQMDSDPARNGQKQVDIMLKLMMDEGPGGGHYDNMMNARFRRVGIGIVYVGGRFYLTNDFSD